MDFKGVPGEEEAERRAATKRFESLYGANVDAKALYTVQPNTWIRFAVVFPRVAFLLRSLRLIYRSIDALLEQFNQNLPREPSHGRSPPLQYDHLDPFAYFTYEEVVVDQRSAFLNLRSALDKWSEGPSGPLCREIAHDILEVTREQDRKSILQELKSEATATDLNSVEANADNDIWTVRREAIARDVMFETSFRRIEQALRQHETSNRDIVEYGIEPVAKATRFVSPERARQTSPQERNGRRPRNGHDRSVSRDTTLSSHRPPSTISHTTWAPEEPEPFELSMKIWSTKKENWVNAFATMDTGCEGGNFVSSVFLEKHLDMVEEAIEDPEAHHVEWVDFGGSKDFKPKSRVFLQWIGRDIENGRKGRRAPKSSSWFLVAPHLDSEDGKQPFDILLGKEWLHENGVVQYRGLRLFKSKIKESAEQRQHKELEKLRRETLRQRIELERRAERGISPNRFSGSIPGSGRTSMNSSGTSLSLRSRPEERADEDEDEAAET